ncbi:MAG: hypothetical protein JWO91_3531 [Acidobacteriaceae bacterium]|nr:hypothetical protein [Acidobacteriaceae bacterium]
MKGYLSSCHFHTARLKGAHKSSPTTIFSKVHGSGTLIIETIAKKPPACSDPSRLLLSANIHDEVRVGLQN